MWTDPIVEEVRAARREISQAAGNNLSTICEQARLRESANAARLAPHPVRPFDAAGQAKERGAA